MLKTYWRMERIIAPSLCSSQRVYEEVLKERIVTGIRWLDVGGGSRVLPDWRLQEEKELAGRTRMFVALDSDLAGLRGHRTVTRRVGADILALPFPDCSFDVVTANMVVEHMERPEMQFREILRTLRPGGLFIFHTPNVFGYTTALARLIPKSLRPKIVWLVEGRASSEVFETFYRANSRRGIARLAQSVGFKTVSMKLTCSNAELVQIPPLAMFELVLIRLLSTTPFEELRTNIIGILQKPEE